MIAWSLESLLSSLYFFPLTRTWSIFFKQKLEAYEYIPTLFRIYENIVEYAGTAPKIEFSSQADNAESLPTSGLESVLFLRSTTSYNLPGTMSIRDLWVRVIWCRRCVMATITLISNSKDITELTFTTTVTLLNGPRRTWDEHRAKIFSHQPPAVLVCTFTGV